MIKWKMNVNLRNGIFSLNYIIIFCKENYFKKYYLITMIKITMKQLIQ